MASERREPRRHGNRVNDYHLLPIFLISLIVLLSATEFGRWLGARASDQGADEILTLQGAVLGLLALMIAFTFAMALSRFEGRRDAVLNEANAIGTTALRARLLPEPHSTETLKLLSEYMRIRLDITQRVPTPEEFSAAVSRSNEIHAALWQQARAMAAKDNGIVPTGLFIQSLNKLIDDQRSG
jgi:hypothetical protein